MNDPSETIRRELTTAINNVEGSREYLSQKHGQIWDTNELQQEFNVLGFASPLIIAKRKCDGVRGTLFFQASPRYYFGFSPE